MLKSLTILKETLLEKVQRKIQFNTPDYEIDEEYLEDLIDEAIGIIRDWRKLSNNDEFLNELYNTNIINYVIETINMSGIEGQSNSNANGNSKTFINTPANNLRTSISQRL